MRASWTLSALCGLVAACAGDVGGEDDWGDFEGFENLSAVVVGTSANLFEAETFALSAGAGQVLADGTASGGKSALIWANGTLTGTTSLALGRLTVRARGDQCNGAPQMVVRVDGRQVLSTGVAATTWTDYGADVNVPAGAHRLEVSFTNDHYAGCDRNLRVDTLTVSAATGVTSPTPTSPTPTSPTPTSPTPAPTSPTTPPPPPPPPSTSPSGNLFSSTKLYVDPNSPAAAQARQWRTSRPADALLMDKVAAGAQADWIGGWTTAAWISSRTAQIAAAGALPVYVFYNIPGRDCGQYSAGGAGSASAYASWISSMAGAIGNNKAVVVLEPDALALTDCLSAAQRDERFAMLKSAVNTLASRGIAVYLDAGHAGWHSAAEMASRLQAAGVAGARGFSLNVSNYGSTSGEVAYGRDIAGRVGKKFVVDTSRNGLGSNGQWCNPSGRALGPRSTSATGYAEVDAFYWFKKPGESDGTCNGGPAAGSWWAEYALGLASRAAY